MELKQFILSELTPVEIDVLFAGSQIPEPQFGVVNYWHNAQEVVELIGNRDHMERYGDPNNIRGDIGELLLEAVVARFPTGLNIKPESHELAKTGQKGFDGTAVHASDSGIVWSQFKFHNPYKSLGADDNGGFDSGIIHQLDSFISATVVDGEQYHKRHRILVGTFAGLHYKLAELGYENKMRIVDRYDLDNIINGGIQRTSSFWADFKQWCLAAKQPKPLPAPVVLSPEQSEDIGKLTSELMKSGAVQYIAPTGSGKTEVFLGVSESLMGQPNGNPV